ncbi:MAG: ATP-binding cassette domain-containing protein [Treponema sp.]|nr:ATP-binding cassette domain-containing protein [Treponema sp.]
MAFCEQCGTKLNEGISFCENCGAKIASVNAPPPQAAPAEKPAASLGKVIVELKEVTKEYKGGKRAVNNFSLTVKEKEFVVLLGSSGSGKSTLLRMIAGHEEVTDGIIRIDDDIMNKILAIDRNISFVSQDYAAGEGGGLFGAKSKERLNRGALVLEMKVSENLAYDLEIKKVPKNVIDRRINDTLKALGCEAFFDKFIKALAAGQKWKIALARAIVRNPKVYLFDEPFAAIDAGYRGAVTDELINVFNSFVRKDYNANAAIIFATSDPNSPAIKAADRVINL